MTNQEKKAWLLRYAQLNKAINQKVDELSVCRAMCEKVTTVMTDMPKGGGKSKEETYIRLADMADEINREIDRYVDMRKEIVDAIRTVPGITLQTLMRLKYIEDKSFEQIAVELDKCWRQTIRLHGDALEKIIIPG